jgi:hypothetical protein
MSHPGAFFRNSINFNFFLFFIFYGDVLVDFFSL